MARSLVRTFGAGALALGLLAAQALPALAVQPDEILKDPALESRARSISAELRCLVCQNQSIDDSDAPLARDLRVLVRERLTQGSSDEEVRRYLVERYGEFVLLRPALNAHTLLLWIGPFAILAAGAAMVWMNARRRQARPVPAGLTAEEAAQLERLAGPRKDA